MNHFHGSLARLLLVATVGLGTAGGAALVAGSESAQPGPAAAPRTEPLEAPTPEELRELIVSAGAELGISVRFLEEGPNDLRPSSLAPEYPSILECGGDDLFVIPPDNGISGQGCVPFPDLVYGAAVVDMMKKMAAYANAECDECANPNECELEVVILAEPTEVATWVDERGWTCAVYTYYGPYFVSCTVC